jgi:hypothetical protein
MWFGEFYVTAVLTNSSGFSVAHTASTVYFTGPNSNTVSRTEATGMALQPLVWPTQAAAYVIMHKQQTNKQQPKQTSLSLQKGILLIVVQFVKCAYFVSEFADTSSNYTRNQTTANDSCFFLFSLRFL